MFEVLQRCDHQKQPKMTLEKFTSIQGIKGQIITELVPMINEITERTRQNVEAMSIEKNGVAYQWTEFDTYCTQVGAIADLMKAMANYLNNDDQLISMSAIEGINGIEISIDILRGGSAWNMITNAIWAGGYNIVREHTRYIVKTNLPRKKSDFAAEFIAEQKKAKKVKEVQSEKIALDSTIEKVYNEMVQNIAKTDAEIIEELKDDNDKNWIFALTIEGAREGRFANQSEFENWKNGIIAEDVQTWKKRNIEWKQSQIDACTKRIKMINERVEALTK